MGTYACRICKGPVHDRTDGEGFKLFRYRFVTCKDCAPKVKQAAVVTKHLAKIGVRAAIAAKSPATLAALDAAFNQAQTDAQNELEPIVAEVVK